MGNLVTSALRKLLGWFIYRIKKYPVASFTVAFLSINNILGIHKEYYGPDNNHTDVSSFPFPMFVAATIFVYLILWLIIVWVVSKNDKYSMKRKLYNHPYASLLLYGFFVTDLLIRAFELENFHMMRIFDSVLTYAFVVFLFWLLICWINSKLFQERKQVWNWYAVVVDKTLTFLPIGYKLVFGLVFSILLFSIIISIFTSTFNYTGQDINRIFSR